MWNRQKLVEVLEAELAFLERGGYRRSPRHPWRPNFVFEDSPTCIHVQADPGRCRPCTQCPLMDFVPLEWKDARIPCRHIPLTGAGETVNTFYETGTEDELEAALGKWLRQRIEELGATEQVFVQGA